MLVHLSPGEMFDLYCTEIGKPHGLIVWYQMNGLIDLNVLNWVRHIRNIPMPKYLESVLNMN